MKTSPAYQAKRGKTVLSDAVKQSMNGLDGAAKAEAARTLVRVGLRRGERRTMLLALQDERGDTQVLVAEECCDEDLLWAHKKSISIVGHRKRYRRRVSAA